MRILIVAPFCSLPGETHFNRFLHLSRVLSENHEVVLITSRFRHFDKEQREISQNSENFSIVLIDEPGYKRNVSLARVLSHAVFLGILEFGLRIVFMRKKRMLFIRLIR